MADDRRAQLSQAILDMMIGIEFTTAIAAQCDALSTSIGSVFYEQGKTREQAETFVRALAIDMVERHIRRHWGTIEGFDSGKVGHA